MEFVISSQNGLIATKPKANLSIEILAPFVTIGFDLGEDHDFELSRSNMEFAISQPKVVQFTWNKKTNASLEPSASNVTIGLTLAMTLTLTFQGHIWN